MLDESVVDRGLEKRSSGTEDSPDDCDCKSMASSSWWPEMLPSQESVAAPLENGYIAAPLQVRSVGLAASAPTVPEVLCCCSAGRTGRRRVLVTNSEP